jgi:hypothetical protein
MCLTTYITWVRNQTVYAFSVKLIKESSYKYISFDVIAEHNRIHVTI